MVLIVIPWIVLMIVWAAVPFAFLGKGRAIGLAVVATHLLLSGVVVLYGGMSDLDVSVLISTVLPGTITAMMRLAMEFTGTLRDPARQPRSRTRTEHRRRGGGGPRRARSGPPGSAPHASSAVFGRDQRLGAASDEDGPDAVGRDRRNGPRRISVSE